MIDQVKIINRGMEGRVEDYFWEIPVMAQETDRMGGWYEMVKDD